jgi:metal-dependent hydrolase (beta-lactamase superfamily II)
VARADQIFDEPIIGVVGGFHYEGYTREQAAAHIVALEPLHLQLVAVSPHDSSIPALEAFRKAFGSVYYEIAVGRPIYFGDAILGY